MRCSNHSDCFIDFISRNCVDMGKYVACHQMQATHRHDQVFLKIKSAPKSSQTRKSSVGAVPGTVFNGLPNVRILLDSRLPGALLQYSTAK